jgi:hypothetical protein
MKTKRNIYIAIFALVAISGGIGIFWWSHTNDNTDQMASINASTNQNSNANEMINNTAPAPTNFLTGALLQEAKARDAKRLGDISTIMTALTSYQGDNGGYPDELIALIPEYLDSVPENPTPKGVTYSYTPIGTAPYSYYSLNYNLEVGSGDVIAGDHEASPDGIATL